jgi:hypothetical protein
MGNPLAAWILSANLGCDDEGVTRCGWAICTIRQQNRLKITNWSTFELPIQQEVQQRMPASRCCDK